MIINGYVCEKILKRLKYELEETPELFLTTVAVCHRDAVIKRHSGIPKKCKNSKCYKISIIIDG